MLIIFAKTPAYVFGKVLNLFYESNKVKRYSKYEIMVSRNKMVRKFNETLLIHGNMLKMNLCHSDNAQILKVGLSRSKKVLFIFFNEIPLKLMNILFISS